MIYFGQFKDAGLKDFKFTLGTKNAQFLGEKMSNNYYVSESNEV